MKKISLLVLHDAVMSSVADAHTLFTGVNDFLINAGREPLFHLQFTGLDKSVAVNNGVFQVQAEVLAKDVKKTDLILIPAITGDFIQTIEKNKGFLPWMVSQYQEGAEVASMCSGAFVLAASGLLNGKECSSHWLSANLFRQLFPDVKLVDGRIVTEQEGIYSSGGANSYWNLLLHLVEKYAGREMAITASKVYAVEIDRKTQSPFAVFNGQKKHVDEPIKQAQEYIEANVSEKLTVDELAGRFAIGKRHFIRRFKNATFNTPIEYIQRVKIEAAKKNWNQQT